MDSNHDRWLFASNPQPIRTGEQVPALSAGRPLTLDSLYAPNLNNLLLNTSSNQADAAERLRSQLLPSPHRADDLHEPQSPTQTLLGLLGLLPNNSGPSPRLVHPENQAARMLDLLAQDTHQQGSLHHLLTQNGNISNGLTPRDEMTCQIVDCACPRLPCPCDSCSCSCFLSLGCS
jgi:hypothetical protein